MISQLGRRIEDHPCLIAVGEVESCDIDETEDFFIADAIFNFRLRQGKEGAL